MGKFGGQMMKLVGKWLMADLFLALNLPAEATTSFYDVLLPAPIERDSNNQMALQLLLFHCADQQGFHALQAD